MSIVGGTAVISPLLNACQSVAPATPTTEFNPPPTAMPVLPTPTQAAQATGTAVPDPTATPQPTTTPLAAAGDVAYVALVKTRDRSAGVRRAVELLGMLGVNGRAVRIGTFNQGIEKLE